MTSEFVAFVDEAGCSGDKYNTGSSQYLVMGAVIVRRCNLNNALSAFAEAREERAKGEIQFRKFSKASDKDNFVLTKLLGRKPIRTAFVGFHKPSLTGTHIRSNHGNEYNYMSKFMIERISWAVRDANSSGGDHKADVVFSHQDMYPQEKFLEYIERLKRGRGRHNTRTNWEHVAQISDTPHKDEGDTHLADLAASSFHMAVEPKNHGMTDDRFFRNLLTKLYRGREAKPHGLKLWPNDATQTAKDEGRMTFLDSL